MKPAEAIDRARAVIRRQHKAIATEQTYLHWLGRYIRALRHLPPELSSEQKMERFPTPRKVIAMRRRYRSKARWTININC